MKNIPCNFCDHYRRIESAETGETLTHLCVKKHPKILRKLKSCRSFCLVYEGGDRE